MHKTRQLLGGFTMHYIFCHRVYTYICCKLVLERRDASTCGKPTQNIPSAPTFSIHDYAAVMQWKIETDTNFFGSLNWVLLSSGKKQQYEHRDMPDGFSQVLLIYWKVFRQRTCIFWTWSTLHTCESLYALLRRCEATTAIQDKNRIPTKNIKPIHAFRERIFVVHVKNVFSLQFAAPQYFLFQLFLSFS